MAASRSLRISAVTLMGLVATIGLVRGLAPVGVRATTAGDPDYEAYRNRTQVPVTGHFRDFKPAGADGGHADFGFQAAAGGGRYANIAADVLAPDGAPQFRSTGFKVFQDWRDAHDRPIPPPRPYIDPRPGDAAGEISAVEGGAVSGAAGFASWFRDTPGVNTTARGTLTFRRDPSTGEYAYEGFLEGPSPTGSSGADDGDSSTTYAVDTVFIHERGRGQFIEVATDGDAWVYVDGRLVLDGGGGAARPWMFTGISVDGSIVMQNNCTVEVAAGTGGTITTNATGAGSVSLSNSASIVGPVLVGPGGDPASVVSGANRINGQIGVMDEPFVMPAIPTPTGLGASRGTVHFNGVNSTINQSFRCGSLIFDGNNSIIVRGHVAILCDTATIRNRTTIDIAPDSSLEIYCLGAFTVDNYVNLNVNTGDPALVTIFVLGNTPVSLPNNATLVANFVSPNVGMTIGNSVTVIGGFYGKSLQVQNGARFVVTPTDPAGFGRGDAHASMSQRIDLDRLNWLRDRRTYRLKMFFADRAPPKSVFRIRTNIDTLNLAAPPPRHIGRD